MSKGVALNTLTPQQARLAPSATDAAMAVMKNFRIPAPTPMVDTTGQRIPVAGGTIRVRIYTPKNATATMPGIVYYQGGGWVIANLNTYDPSRVPSPSRLGRLWYRYSTGKRLSLSFPRPITMPLPPTAGCATMRLP
ncbi:hypothetical protein [Hymenobacter sp. AT01-02]|uniref:hypothetical protein n=1 Tax=Hymenobacter sp. AT01-02 TaxID=1571877 RepID=UPI001F226EDE|nr:hypothetical protein [Hymenobacter sp. AT01-02]